MSNPFDLLLNEPAREESTWKWATVTGLSPLRVRLDQEPLSLGVTPINLAGPLVEGDRVWVQMHRSRGMKGAQPIIHGTGTWHVPEPVAGRIWADRSQSIPTSTLTRLNIFGSSEVSGGVVALGNYGLRVPVPGWYSLTAGLRWDGSSTSVQLRILVGNTMAAQELVHPADASGVTSSAATNYRLAANAEVTIEVYVTAARETSTAGTFYPASHLSAVKIA